MTVSVLGRLRLTRLTVDRALADWIRQGRRAEPRPCPRMRLSRTNTPHRRVSNIGDRTGIQERAPLNFCYSCGVPPSPFCWEDANSTRSAVGTSHAG
jgi:hypothetical protein